MPETLVFSELQVKRLREAVEYAEMNPKALNMSVYVSGDEGDECGTVACLAGWLVIREYGLGNLSYETQTVYVPGWSEPIEIEEAAVELIGLDPLGDEAHKLFHSYGVQADTLRKHVEETLGVTL